MTEAELILVCLAPFGAGLLALVLVPFLAHRAGPILALVPAAAFVALLLQVGNVYDGEYSQVSYRWVEALGVDFALRLDGLSLLFGLLITGIGSLVVLYAGSYLKGHERLARFYLLLFIFMGAMLGLVLADNLITLFVFWELTSISSFGLISFESEKTPARTSALQALLVTGGGGLALLGGLVMIGFATGSQSISEILANQQGVLQEHSLYEPILILMLAGAFTKSAQVPFHFWLPNAMEAPTPVSAYLHSATMVKAGVYLLARFSPVLGDTDPWFVALVGFGAVTALTGGFMALRETDLKRILAYLTLSILGTLVMLIGAGTEETLLAAMVLILAHALYKAALFFSAGIVDHETGTRNVDALGGLAKVMPFTAAAVIIAAASMAGVVPFAGFIAKESVYESLQETPDLALLLTIAAMLSSLAGVIAAMIIVVRPFFGAKVETPKHAHEAPWQMLAGPLLLGALTFSLAVLPFLSASNLLASAASASAGERLDAKVYLWHGFNVTLLLSTLTLIAGIVLYRWHRQIRESVLRSRPALARVAPGAVYQSGLDGVLKLAALQTKVLQNGYLRRYVTVTALTAMGLAGATLLLKDAVQFPSETADIGPVEVVASVVVLMGAVVAVTAATRLAAVISLGMVGYGISLIYILFGAPDLAMTQILVETLAVLLFVFAFYQLPRFASFSPPAARLRDAAIAGFCGLVVFALLLSSLSVEHDKTLSNAISEASKPVAYGANVVNVILVDFRALDTLGEISVLAVAALGVVILLSAAWPAGEPPRISSLILEPMARFLVPMQIVFSFYLLWRGHNDPGGGFIAGLVVGSAVGLSCIAFTLQRTKRMLRLQPLTYAGIGLVVASVAGIIGVFSGDAFLTGKWVELGSLKLGTPFLFDVGVYLVVIGVSAAVIFSLMERSTVDGDS